MSKSVLIFFCILNAGAGTCPPQYPFSFYNYKLCCYNSVTDDDNGTQLNYLSPAECCANHIPCPMEHCRTGKTGVKHIMQNNTLNKAIISGNQEMKGFNSLEKIVPTLKQTKLNFFCIRLRSLATATVAVR